MAPSKSKPATITVPVGNCEVSVDSGCYSLTSDSDRLLRISVSRKAEITITFRGYGGRCNDDGQSSSRNGGFCNAVREEDSYFLTLLNPKDVSASVSERSALIKAVVQLYLKELPTMKYAANTGKESTFLERCVSRGKYCTLVLKSKSIDGQEETVAAITYQIVPVDMRFAEIPLAAVSSEYQKKGFGALLFTELKNRLGHVGIGTIFCWGDQESEGFWFKMGFVSIAEVNNKVRTRRFPVRADIRKALCFPGGSTLMVSHISNHFAINVPCSVKSCMKQRMGSSAPSHSGVQGHGQEHCGTVIATAMTENCRPENVLDDTLPGDGKMIKSSPSTGNVSHGSLPSKRLHNQQDGCIAEHGEFGAGDDADRRLYSAPEKKSRIWEASISSLKSKKVKGGHVVDCDSNPSASIDGSDPCFRACSLGVSGNKFLAEANSNFPLTSHFHDKSTFSLASRINHEDTPVKKLHSGGDCYKIMLIDIADDFKKAYLTKMIEELGGVVVLDGRMSTHLVVAGKVRRTLNVCTALCSGAWIVSPSWLKQSCREGRFVEEMAHVLSDRDYLLKYKSDLKDAILRGRARPGALLEGFQVCIGTHVQPSAKTLTAIVTAAGGQVIGLNEVKNAAKTFFVASEEDMEEAMVAIRKRLWTFSSDWFMNFVMKQELDLGAPQFAESL